VVETSDAESADDADPPEAAEAPEESRRAQLVHHLKRWRHHKDLVVLGIGILVSGITTVIGIAHLSWPWLFVLGCSITAAAALVTRALAAEEPKDREWSLWAALIVVVLIPVGAFCYHEWWDPSRTSPSSNEVMVKGTDLQVFVPYDEPGGSQSYEYSVINSDEPISLVCYVSLPDGLWYQIYGNGGWIPQDAVHAIPGIAFPDPPHC
jgi:hypothetical protein